MNRPDKPFYERCYERIEAYSSTSECDQRTNNCRDGGTSNRWQPLQAMVSDSATASQLKVDFWRAVLWHAAGLIA